MITCAILYLCYWIPENESNDFDEKGWYYVFGDDGAKDEKREEPLRLR